MMSSLSRVVITVFDSVQKKEKTNLNLVSKEYFRLRILKLAISFRASGYFFNQIDGYIFSFCFHLLAKSNPAMLASL